VPPMLPQGSRCTGNAWLSNSVRQGFGLLGQRRLPPSSDHSVDGCAGLSGCFDKVQDRFVSDEADPDDTIQDAPSFTDATGLAEDRSPLWVRWTAGAVIVGALAAGLTLYYGTRVCNERVADGEIVEVCRQLEASDPPMVAVGLAALVALTAFFSEITGFGVSLKREVRATSQKASAALAKASVAKSTSVVAQDLAFQRPTMHQSPETMSGTDVMARIEELAGEYNAIRAREPTSTSRSASMTTVVTKMLSELSGVESERFSLQPLLVDAGNDGHRVAAYAYLYANPIPGFTQALVQAILSEPTRFGQYWAIRALSRIVERQPDSLDFNSQRELRRLLASLGPNTDRAYELRNLLNSAPHK
jgi:hypothetical protein